MRQTSVVDLPTPGIGTRYHLKVHEYMPIDSNLTPNDLEYFSQDRAYIQASLHADELPGLLVCHHLIKLLDKAASRNSILKHICVVPFANPIGLSQRLLGHHMGRFSLGTGVNFNRDWIDVTNAACEKVQGQLIVGDCTHNVAVIRKALYDETDKINNLKVENVMKKMLFRRAAISSIVLDLHCDSEAVMHMYTHDRLWPAMQDLAALIESQCNLIAGWSGGNPFDEACSCPWATISDKYPDFNIPMACQSATIELRGETDVYDSLAEKDAANLYRFLVHRGYIKDEEASSSESISNYNIPATPLTGVDMIEAPVAGVFAWKVRVGDYVTEGQLLGEVINIEDVDAARTPIIARNSGLIFGIRPHKLAVPGEIGIKVAGSKNLEWRTGNLLTAR